MMGADLQQDQPTLMDELLALGVLRLLNRQVVLDPSFHEVLQTEMCRVRADQKRSIVNLIHLYFPDIDIDRLTGYAVFLENSILHN
jgi:hypothetical protein